MNSGTENLFATSDWHKTQGEAEAQCLNEMDSLIESTISRLESEGKQVVGSVNYSLEFEEQEREDEIYFRCYTSTEVNWVYEDSNDKNLLSESFAGIPKSTPSRFVVLEDELLNRFKRKFGAGYHSMELTSVSILASDVKIGNKISSIPDTFNNETYISKNCTQQTRNFKNRLQVTTVEGEKFSFEKAITTRNEAKFGLTYKVASAQFGMSRELKVTNRTEQSFQRTEMFEESFEREVSPMKELIVKIQRKVSTDVHKLEGNIIFDGNVRVTFSERKCDRVRIGFSISWNCRNVHSSRNYLLSQVLNENERNIDINGQATISSSRNAETSVYYLEQDANCENIATNEDFGGNLTYDNRFEFNLLNVTIDEQAMVKLK